MKKLAIAMMMAMASVVCVAADAKDAKPAKADTAEAKEKVEARCRRVIKNAISLFEQGENERAVGMLEAVGRMYPDAEERFGANLELGRHFLDKRDFDRAGAELRTAQRSAKDDVRAEALLLQGQLHNSRGESSEAMMVLRRLTQDYPTSRFSNDAYFLIGQIHFDARRWTRAAEAFHMVGTAVPQGDTNETVLVEAGQRVFIHVHDKDLAVLNALGEKTEVVLESKSGDSEKAVLEPFGRGDGDFIASVRTSSDPSQPGDGVLTVHGAEQLKVCYVDRNTEKGEVAKKVDAEAAVVSTGSIAFMDGAMRQRVRGVFAGQPALIRVRDLDLDVTPQADKTKIVLKVQFRERPEPPPGADPNDPPPPPAPDAPWLTRDEVELEVVETAPRSGVFTGRVTPKILATNETAKAGEIAVQPEDRIEAVYLDDRYLDGRKPVERTADVRVLVGGSTEPQSVMAHATEPTLQAKKLLLEAQLLFKWGSIFKDVGLEANANAKADEGLERVDDVFELMKHNSLKREVIENAYEVRWDLLLVKGKLAAAIETCRALVRKYPDTILADRAFMQIANANRAQDTDEGRRSAVQVYNSILAMANSPLKAEAQFRIGEIMEVNARLNARSGAKPDFSSAMIAFKRCADAYPNSSYAGESIKRVIDYFISIRDYNRAVETLDRVFQDYPDAPWLDEMLLKWGVVCHRLGNRAQAIEKFHRLLEEYPGGSSAKQAAKFLQKLEK